MAFVSQKMQKICWLLVALIKVFCYFCTVIWINSIIMGATVKNSKVNGMAAVKAVVVKETTKMPLISRGRKFQFYKSQGLDLIYYGN